MHAHARRIPNSWDRKDSISIQRLGAEARGKGNRQRQGAEAKGRAKRQEAESEGLGRGAVEHVFVSLFLKSDTDRHRERQAQGRRLRD